MRWDALKNGELLAAAASNGIEVMVTGDKNLSYQQNLKDRKLALIVLRETDVGNNEKGDHDHYPSTSARYRRGGQDRRSYWLTWTLARGSRAVRAATEPEGDGGVP